MAGRPRWGPDGPRRRGDEARRRQGLETTGRRAGRHHIAVAACHAPAALAAYYALACFRDRSGVPGTPSGSRASCRRPCTAQPMSWSQAVTTGNASSSALGSGSLLSPSQRRPRRETNGPTGAIRAVPACGTDDLHITTLRTRSIARWSNLAWPGGRDPIACEVSLPHPGLIQPRWETGALGYCRAIDSKTDYSRSEGL